jgi:hypothetical protein
MMIGFGAAMEIISVRFVGWSERPVEVPAVLEDEVYGADRALLLEAGQLTPATQQWWQQLATSPKPVLLVLPAGRRPWASCGGPPGRSARTPPDTSPPTGPDRQHHPQPAARPRGRRPSRRCPTSRTGQPCTCTSKGTAGAGSSTPSKVIGWCTDLRPVLLHLPVSGPLAKLAADIER